MKKLQIDENQALKLYKTASNEFKTVLENTFGKDYFNQKITDKIQNLDDILDYLDLEEGDVYVYPKNTKDKYQRYMNACAIIPKIVEVYNEGEILNWKNTSQYKYLPCKYFSGGSWLVTDDRSWAATAYCSGFSYYKSNQLANDALTKFRDIYEDFWNIK
jgi:hypothetical protein